LEKLKVLQEALASGLHKGALIHEKTGTTRAVDVLSAEADRLIAVARIEEGALALFSADAKVRVELPQEAAIIHVPGRVRELRCAGELAEVEISCVAPAESRQRRMDVRIDAQCRIRLGGDGEWDETRTVNLSAGGALVVSDTRARVGEQVDVELELEGELIRCRAEVVRRGVKTQGASPRTSAAGGSFFRRATRPLHRAEGCRRVSISSTRLYGSRRSWKTGSTRPTTARSSAFLATTISRGIGGESTRSRGPINAAWS